MSRAIQDAVAQGHSIQSSCQAFGLPRASYYRLRQEPHPKQEPQPKAYNKADGPLRRQEAGAGVRRLGARYLLQGHIHSAYVAPDEFTGLLSVQLSGSLELIDENGSVLFQRDFTPTADDPLDTSDVSEEGAASKGLKQLGERMADALLPKLHALMAPQSAP